MSYDGAVGGCGVMAEYRVYCFDGAGHIRLAEPIEARDDAEAIAQAREMPRGTLKCEVWRDNRLVATLNAQDLGD